jgi:AcrR family transcriptional regulator
LQAFSALPEEKRQRIIDAAMDAFAAHGYRKASVADIAGVAGISKAMVFTYFGTKGGLYEYLVKLVLRITFDTFNAFKPQLLGVVDYFERISLSARIKVEMMKAHPAILGFSVSMYMERDPQVRPAIQTALADAFKLREEMLSLGIEGRKFKNPAHIGRLTRMTEWLISGCAEDWKRQPLDALDEVTAIFDDCLDALKRHYYKEEYL